jgi:hypothetical protein
MVWKLDSYSKSDGANRRYNDACKWLRLKHLVYDSELKNLMMERFVQQIKDRTEKQNICPMIDASLWMNHGRINTTLSYASSTSFKKPYISAAADFGLA